MVIGLVLLVFAVLATAVSLTLFAVTAWRDRDSLHDPRPEALAKEQLHATLKMKYQVPPRFRVEPFSQQATDLRNVRLYVPILKYADISLGQEAVQSYRQSQLEGAMRDLKRTLRETFEQQKLNQTPLIRTTIQTTSEHLLASPQKV